MTRDPQPLARITMGRAVPEPEEPPRRHGWWIVPGAVVGILIWIAALTSCAHAEPGCAPYRQAVADLAAGYGERAIMRGLDGRGIAIELLISPAGTWTILAIRPDGIACVVAEGEAAEVVPLPVDERKG